MCITSWYPKFNGSHFGLPWPPSSIHRMTGLCGRFDRTLLGQEQVVDWEGVGRMFRYYSLSDLFLHWVAKSCELWRSHTSAIVHMINLVSVVVSLLPRRLARRLHQVGKKMFFFPTWRSLRAKRRGNCLCFSCVCTKMSSFSSSNVVSLLMNNKSERTLYAKNKEISKRRKEKRQENLLD